MRPRAAARLDLGDKIRRPRSREQLTAGGNGGGMNSGQSVSSASLLRLPVDAGALLLARVTKTSGTAITQKEFEARCLSPRK